MIKGKNLDRELLTAQNKTVFDLSGAAATETVLFNKNHEIQINKVWVYYEEATSADAGVSLRIGSPTDDDAYWVETSEVSKSAGDCTEYGTGDMVLATVPKSTPIIVKSAGSKTGTGTAYIVIAYTVGD